MICMTKLTDLNGWLKKDLTNALIQPVTGKTLEQHILSFIQTNITLTDTFYLTAFQQALEFIKSSFGFRVITLPFDANIPYNSLYNRFCQFFIEKKDVISLQYNSHRTIWEEFNEALFNVGLTTIDYTSTNKQTNLANIEENFLNNNNLNDNYLSNKTKTDYDQTITGKDRLQKFLEQIFANFKITLMDDFEKMFNDYFLFNTDIIDGIEYEIERN